MRRSKCERNAEEPPRQLRVEARASADESLPLPVSPFDGLAQDYDTSFTSTTLGNRLREAVWERYDSRFAGCRRLLDIGCGTGEDAIYLARRGHDVVATDVSQAMLDVAAEKAGRAGCAGRIEFRRLPMQRLGDELSDERFDGVCSNFGALNCTSSLGPIVAAVARSLSPAAPLVWVVMGRHVPWEWAWFLARCDWRKAFRRLDRCGTRWRGQPIHYPTPRELSDVLRPHFATVRRHALGCVLPPSYASAWLNDSPRLFAMLAGLERAASHWQLLAGLADHFILEARRTEVRLDA